MTRACPGTKAGFIVLLLLAGSIRAEDTRSTTVGVTGRIEQLVLPGGELEAVPKTDRKAPLELRVARTFPHGSAFRYDLEYQGLEPGRFDLKNYLRRKDGLSTADLPAIVVEVSPLLQPGQVVPHALEIHKPPPLGGYRTLRIAAGVGWGLGLIAILYFGFLRRKKDAKGPVAGEPLSLADRIRPLVEGAIAGKLSQPQLASLERSLLAYWRRRLRLEASDPAQAMETLRSHAEAGPLLEQLDVWLHRPGRAGPLDLPGLLAPYQRIPADALERSGP
jgi:hypothetical protein